MYEEIYTLIVFLVGTVFGHFIGRASCKTDVDNMSFKVLKLEMELDTIRRLNAAKEKK